MAKHGGVEVTSHDIALHQKRVFSADVHNMRTYPLHYTMLPLLRVRSNLAE